METSWDEARVDRCRRAIRQAFGTPEDEVGATLFVSHHLEEIEAGYWKTHFGSAAPEPLAVIDGLVPVRRQTEGDGYSIDFSLPGAVTNYVVCVRIDAHDGAEVSMES